jgi:hypothetical protein
MNWLRTFGHQIGVKECEVGELILGIIMDVLVHVPIQNFQGFGVDRISRAARNFAVWDSSEFIVLDPEIGLEDFRRRREPEQGSIAGCDWVVVIALVLLAKHSCGRPKQCGPGTKRGRADSDPAKK